MRLASELARAAQDVLGAAGINLKQSNGEIAGQDVYHLNLHVIPATSMTACSGAACRGAPPWEPPALTDREQADISAALAAALPSA